MKIITRVILDVAVFASAVTLPWWITFILCLTLVIKFNFYLEMVFFGFVIDALYGSKISVFSNFELIFTTLFTVFFIAVQYFKKSFRFNN